MSLARTLLLAVVGLAGACAHPTTTPQPFAPGGWRACLVDDVAVGPSSARPVDFHPKPGRAVMFASKHWGTIEPRIGELLLELPKAPEGSAEFSRGRKAIYMESLQVGSDIRYLRGTVRWRDLGDGRHEFVLDLTAESTNHRIVGTLVAKRVAYLRDCS